MLNGTFALHDIENVEGFCEVVLQEQLRKFGSTLKTQDKEDCLSYLISTAWELSVKWEADRNYSFSQYAGNILKLRVVDWYRNRFGDSRYASKPEIISLQAWDEGASHVGAEDEALVSLEVSDELLSGLSEQGRWILNNVAIPKLERFTHKEIADLHGQRVTWVSEQLRILEQELRDAL